VQGPSRCIATPVGHPTVLHVIAARLWKLELNYRGIFWRNAAA